VRITFVNASALAVAGGIETTVWALARELGRRHDVTVLAGRPPHDGARKDPLDRVRTVPVPFLPRFDPPNRFVAAALPFADAFAAESLAFYLGSHLSREGREAIVHADVVSLHARWDSLLFSRWASAHGVPSVFHIQGGRFGPLFRATDRSAAYVAISEDVRQDIETRWGLPIAGVVTPGVPRDVLNRDLPPLNPFEDIRYVLFVARLQPSKGTRRLLSIFSWLRRREPGLHLVIAGDGEDAGFLTAQATRLGLGAAVHFLGSIPHEDVFRLYRHAALVLHPTEAESFGLVPLEALACGTPVVTTDLSSTREAAGPLAAYVRDATDEGWGRACLRVLKDEECRTRVRREGPAWAEQYAWDVVATTYERFLRAAVEGG
jgi:glycosyltransferase involved in cell wall biosynthesis